MRCLVPASPPGYECPRWGVVKSGVSGITDRLGCFMCMNPAFFKRKSPLAERDCLNARRRPQAATGEKRPVACCIIPPGSTGRRLHWSWWERYLPSCRRSSRGHCSRCIDRRRRYYRLGESVQLRATAWAGENGSAAGAGIETYARLLGEPVGSWEIEMIEARALR
jgi:hypothetical protein